MNWLLDENIDRVLAERLRELGYDVTYIAEVDASASDEEVLARALDSEALLLTSDKDFGELVFRRRLVPRGVVLLRLFGLATEEKLRIIDSLLAEHADEIIGNFVVVSPTAIRIRSMIA